MTADQLVLILNLAAGTLLPVLVGLVTQKATNSTIKAVLLATLSFASGIIGQLIANGGIDGFDWFTALLNGGGAWVVGVATYFGLWKTTPVIDTVQAVGSGKHLA